MKKNGNRRKYGLDIKTRPIVCLMIALGFLSAVLLVTMLASAEGAPASSKASHSEDSKKEEENQSGKAGSEFLGVVKEIDADRMQITLYDIDRQTDCILSYSGGTNITDKFGQVIAMSQITAGTMVDVSCQTDQRKLTGLSISSRAWEYVGVNNMGIDRIHKVIKIASNKYKYTDDIVILDGQEFISISNLAEQDQLTVRGFEETIWSITVTKGHGTVKLTDYEELLGSHITIGYESMQQITEDMVITVREGNFNLTVENGDYSATKNITIRRNEETVVSLSDLGPAAPKQGRVTFEITPFGADLYIDRELISYASPLELTYGEYKIEVALAGYTSYEGILTVDTAGKTVKINLPKASSNEEAEVSETNSGSAAGSGGTNTSEKPSDIKNTGNSKIDTEQDNEADEAIIDKEHLVYVQNPIGASVYLDGDFMCISPGSFKKVIGSHVITFIEEGYETMSYTIEINDDNKDTYISMPDLVKK